MGIFFAGMAIDNDDDNASEHEDAPGDRELPITVRQSSLNEGESVEATPYNQQENRQGEESDPELDLLAETESDSDDNHSNQDAASAQRSVQTGATAGSDTGSFYVEILIKICTKRVFLLISMETNFLVNVACD